MVCVGRDVALAGEDIFAAISENYDIIFYSWTQEKYRTRHEQPQIGLGQSNLSNLHPLPPPFNLPLPHHWRKGPHTSRKRNNSEQQCHLVEPLP